jgi:hypothetical protein
VLGDRGVVAVEEVDLAANVLAVAVADVHLPLDDDATVGGGRAYPGDPEVQELVDDRRPLRGGDVGGLGCR